MERLLLEMSPPETIRTDQDLKDYLLLSFGLTIPDVQVCPNHSTPFRAFSDAYFACHDVIVIKASRGFGGKSFLLATLGLTEATTLGADVNILGGSGQQSKNVHKHMADLWGYPGAPHHLLKAEPSTWHTKFKKNNEIIALMASQGAVRGPHPQRLRLDEVDEMSLSILDAALGQPMDSGGIASQTVMSSTHQYPDGTMTEILKRAVEKGWPIHEWCWRETSASPTGWLSLDQVEKKRGTVTQAMWDVEYELQEPSSEGRAILSEKVQAMFRENFGEWEGKEREYIEIEPPIDDATYATGADWAKKRDKTVIITLRTDCNPMRVVAFEQTYREPWPTMVGRYNKRLARYPGEGCHDGTGVGDVVTDYLTERSESFIFKSGKTRSDLLTEYTAAIEDGEIISAMVKYMYNEHLYASIDDLFGSGHLPDTIAAGALAYRASGRSGVFFA